VHFTTFSLGGGRFFRTRCSSFGYRTFAASRCKICNSLSLFLPHFSADARMYFFSNRVINIWNSLPASTDFTNIYLVLLSGPLQFLTLLHSVIVLNFIESQSLFCLPCRKRFVFLNYIFMALQRRQNLLMDHTELLNFAELFHCMHLCWFMDLINEINKRNQSCHINSSRFHLRHFYWVSEAGPAYHSVTFS